MSSKKKSTKKMDVKSLSPKALEQSAASFYSIGNYKDALSRYELIHRASPDDLIKERLIHCYQERSKELREKGLYLEASALLGNLHRLAPESLPINDYLTCLVDGGYYGKALKLCNELSIADADVPVPIAAKIISYMGVVTELTGHLFQHDVGGELPVKQV